MSNPDQSSTGLHEHKRAARKTSTAEPLFLPSPTPDTESSAEESTKQEPEIRRIRETAKKSARKLDYHRNIASQVASPRSFGAHAPRKSVAFAQDDGTRPPRMTESSPAIGTAAGKDVTVGSLHYTDFMATL